MIGIIGGSGLYDSLEGMEIGKRIEVETEHGSATLMEGRLGGVDVLFLSRHGDDVKYPPHAVNYRANIRALSKMGVHTIIATSAVGVLKFRFKLGVLTLPDQLVDLTGRVMSFYNGGESGIVHTDISDPFCPRVSGHIQGALRELDIKYQTGGTYLCLSGPTFETKAEIRLFQGLGMDFIGMTLAHECKLAREMNMCYSPILLPVNYGAGMTDEMITHDTTLRMVNEMTSDLSRSLASIVSTLPELRNCACPDSVSRM